MNAQTGEVAAVRPFAAVLQDQRQGALHRELGVALTEVVQAVLDTGKAGAVTLTLKVSSNKDGVSVSVTDEIKSKVPELPTPAAIFFADEVGNLTRSNPNQTSLPVAEVPARTIREEAV